MVVEWGGVFFLHYSELYSFNGNSNNAEYLTIIQLFYHEWSIHKVSGI